MSFGISEMVALMALKGQVVERYKGMRRAGMSAPEAWAIIEGVGQVGGQMYIPIYRVWCNEAEGEISGTAKD